MRNREREREREREGGREFFTPRRACFLTRSIEVLFKSNIYSHGRTYSSYVSSNK